MLPGDTRQAGSLPGQVNGPYRTGIRAGITMMMSSLSVLRRIGARRHRTADIRGLLTQIPDAGFWYTPVLRERSPVAHRVTLSGKDRLRTACKPTPVLWEIGGQPHMAARE